MRWIAPLPISSSQHQVITSVETSGIAYQVLNGTPFSGEYFLIENRQQTGFDIGLPGSGLLIWHVDGDIINDLFYFNEVNNYECHNGPISCSMQHYGVELVQADGRWDPETGRNPGDAGDPYPGIYFNTSFTDTSNPLSGLFSGFASGLSISNIATEGSYITADMTPPSCDKATLTVKDTTLPFHIPVLKFDKSYYSVDMVLTPRTDGRFDALFTGASLLNNTSAPCSKAGLNSDLWDSNFWLSLYEFYYLEVRYSLELQLSFEGNNIIAEVRALYPLP